MASTKNKAWLLGAIATFGLVVGYVTDTLEGAIPSFHQVLQLPAVGVMVTLITLVTTAALVLWAQQGGSGDRKAFVAAILVAGGVAILFHALAQGLGWWSGLFFQAPLFVLALLTGLQAIALFALFLLAYRWLAVRWPRLALLVYGLLVLLVIAGTLVGDQSLLRSGMYVFQGGYTIATDVVYGVVIFCLPLVLYHIIRQRQRVASAKIASMTEDKG
jgi:hypothetical protein